MHVDFAGPMERTMFLIVIYAHLKWIEVFPMAIASYCLGNHIGTKRVKLFSLIRIPESIVSDSGPQFNS